MKKIYEKPVLTTEQFDVDDVITASSNNALDTVAGGIGNMENPVDLGNLSNSPGQD